MSRRRPQAEVQFGSDSFLDVVANIVGILIILIVVAGLRISKTPTVIGDIPEVESTETIDVPVASSNTEAEQTNDEPPAAPKVVVMEPIIEEIVVEEPAEPLPPLPPLVVPRELVELTEKLESDIAALRTEETNLANRLKNASDQQSSLLEKQLTIRSQMTEKKQEIDQTRKKAAVIAADLDLARETLVRLTNQVRELESEPENVETLEHKVTPISRVVSGKEKHYRLEKNRIAEVPIEDLIERFRDQIERRRDWLVKTRQHQGQIGPIRGFNMQYVVRVESMSEMDSMRAGYGGYRINLAQWEIHPEPDTKGETAEVALRKGSQFYQSILGTSSDTTLTFWVYPDSFELFRKLQKFTHEHGYSVAARPLPPGVPIAGSPNGSKSASQ